MLAALSTPDLIVGAVCGIFAVRGAFKGFAWQAVRTGGLILAIVAAMAGHDAFGRWLDERVDILPDPTTPIVAWVAIFIAVLLVATWFAWMARGALRQVKLGGLDRLFGFALGAVMGLVVVTLVYVVIGGFVSKEYLREKMEGSLSVRGIAEVLRVGEPFVPELFHRHWEEVFESLPDVERPEEG
jgi:uncharacterized membrane protein required for colicin V production